MNLNKTYSYKRHLNAVYSYIFECIFLKIFALKWLVKRNTGNNSKMLSGRFAAAFFIIQQALNCCAAKAWQRFFITKNC